MPRSTLRRYFRHGLFPQLMVFEAVARLGGVTRAAEALHLAQPTVSMQIKKLAATLELELFEQRGRRIVLTPAGEALRAVCEELEAVFERAESCLAAFRKQKTPMLKLAAEPEARAAAAQLMARYCAAHPGIQASLHVAERAELLARLAAEEDDVYLFELELDEEPLNRRLSVVHAKGREIARDAARFLREALSSDAYNRANSGGDGQDDSTGIQRGSRSR